MELSGIFAIIVEIIVQLTIAAMIRIFVKIAACMRLKTTNGSLLDTWHIKRKINNYA